MNDTLKNFINNNLDLINQNTKESWEKIYRRFLLGDLFGLSGEFTKIILDSGINDPTIIMGYVPDNYLYQSTIRDYKIPDSVISIGEEVFQNCGNLTSVVIPDSITSISKSTFSDCSSLVSVVIPSSVTSIDEYAFLNCSNLKEVNFKGTRKQAINLGIGIKSKKRWRKNSAIQKIICADGIIYL